MYALRSPMPKAMSNTIFADYRPLLVAFWGKEVSLKAETHKVSVESHTPPSTILMKRFMQRSRD